MVRKGRRSNERDGATKIIRTPEIGKISRMAPQGLALSAKGGPILFRTAICGSPFPRVTGNAGKSRAALTEVFLLKGFLECLMGGKTSLTSSL